MFSPLKIWLTFSSIKRHNSGIKFLFRNLSYIYPLQTLAGPFHSDVDYMLDSFANPVKEYNEPTKSESPNRCSFVLKTRIIDSSFDWKCIRWKFNVI